MRIVNVMFSRGLGGIEQSLLDYCDALRHRGHDVTAIIHPNAQIRLPLEQLSQQLDFNVETVRNFGQWDLFAVKRLRSILKDIKPDAVITFGNRAVSLIKPAAKGIAPVIARTPNYSVDRLIGLAGIFHSTNNLKRHIIAKGQPPERMYHVPNMIKLPENHKVTFKTYRKPAVIGTMGRFVAKKGFADFLHALSKLKAEHIPFTAIIGGEGEEEKNLKELTRRLNLENEVTFCGWVEDKKAFFDSIDIFCLPSLHEPFGIVLLEAFLHAKPVVTTNSEGPTEIATHDHDALIVPKGNVRAMADALKELLLDPPRAEIYAINATKTLKKRYDMKVVAETMDNALKEIVQ